MKNKKDENVRGMYVVIMEDGTKFEGSTFTSIVQQMAMVDHTTADVWKYMKKVKERVKEQKGIDLVFRGTKQFIHALREATLIHHIIRNF